VKEDHQAHLEMIQVVISRMAQNSFAFKGWAVTLVAGMFALADKEARACYFLLALLPTVIFWALDAYYLRQEKLFRHLYDTIRRMSDDQWERDPFTMDTKPYCDQAPSTWKALRSATLGWLYGSLALAILLVTGVVFVVKK